MKGKPACSKAGLRPDGTSNDRYLGDCASRHAGFVCQRRSSVMAATADFAILTPYSRPRQDVNRPWSAAAQAMVRTCWCPGMRQTASSRAGWPDLVWTRCAPGRICPTSAAGGRWCWARAGGCGATLIPLQAPGDTPAGVTHRPSITPMTGGKAQFGHGRQRATDAAQRPPISARRTSTDGTCCRN